MLGGRNMHTATYYIDLLLSGITVGSLYALIAIGYTMVSLSI